MNPFSVLTSKIFAGVSAALLIALVVAGLMLRSAWGTIEDQRNAIAGCNAAREVQNAAIRRLGDEGARQREAFAAAVARGQATILEAQGRVRIVRQTAANGCPTPPEIRGAGL